MTGQRMLGGWSGFKARPLRSWERELSLLWEVDVVRGE